MFWFYWSQTALGLDDYDGYVARLKKAIAAEPKTYEPALGDAFVTVARRYQQRGDNKRCLVRHFARSLPNQAMRGDLSSALRRDK